MDALEDELEDEPEPDLPELDVPELDVPELDDEPELELDDPELFEPLCLLLCFEPECELELELEPELDPELALDPELDPELDPDFELDPLEPELDVPELDVPELEVPELEALVPVEGGVVFAGEVEGFVLLDELELEVDVEVLLLEGAAAVVEPGLVLLPELLVVALDVVLVVEAGAVDAFDADELGPPDEPLHPLARARPPRPASKNAIPRSFIALSPRCRSRRSALGTVLKPVASSARERLPARSGSPRAC